MRRITLAFVAGFTVAAGCILWIARRSRGRLEPPQSSPIAAPEPPPPSPPHPSSVRFDAELKLPYYITLLVGIILVFGSIFLYTWGRNAFSLPPIPDYFAGAFVFPYTGPPRTVPLAFDPSFTQGVSTVPEGDLIASTSPQAHGTLMFYISQIKNDTPSAATITGTLSLVVPTDLQAAICDESIGLYVSFPNRNNDCSVATKLSYCVLVNSNDEYRPVYVLKQKYTSEMLTLSIKNNVTSSPLYSTRLPLGDFFSIPTAQTAGVACNTMPPDLVQITFPLPVTLPLYGQGQAYPDDWYLANYEVLITLPYPLSVLDQHNDFIYNLPIDLRVAANTSLSDFNLQIGPGSYGEDFSSKQAYAFGASKFILLATRNNYSRIRTYVWVGIFPVIFFLIFLWTLFPRFTRPFFSSKRRGRISQKLSATTIYNIFILVLSLVFLRPILIPSDLQGGATHADFYLILGGMIPLLLLFIRCFLPTKWVS